MRVKFGAAMVALSMLTACDERPKETIIRPTQFVGVNVWTEVEFKIDHITAPEVTVAMADAIAEVAAKVRSGDIKPSTETDFAQFWFTATSLDGGTKSDLLNIRIPIERLVTSHDYEDARLYLDLADVVEIGGSPEALISPKNYCQDSQTVTPHFCSLVGGL